MSDTPALSLHLRNFSATEPGSWDPLLARAQAADVAGVDRVVVSDHVVFGDDLGDYADPARGGVVGGTQPTGPDGHWLEPLTVLSVVAGRTSRVRLHTAVLLAALRRPAVLAKQLATLDVLSGGRLDVGVGVGWQRAEYDACGLDYHGRGALLDHTLTVLGELWSTPSAELHLETGSVAGLHAMPKPVRPDGVPLWISGRLNAAVLERIVRFGSGWIPWGEDAADPVAGLARIRTALQEAGRPTAGFEVTATLATVRTATGELDLEATMAGASAMAEGGVTDLRIHLDVPDDADHAVAHLREVVEAFRRAVGRDAPS